MHINPLYAELNPICHLLALLGAHHILHVSRIKVKSVVSCSRFTASDGGAKSQKMDLKECRSKRLCPNLLKGHIVGLGGQEHREQSQSARLQGHI